MKLHLLLLPVLAVAMTHQTAPSQQQRLNPVYTAVPEPHVSLCVTTSYGTCGSHCEAFLCVPNYTMAGSGEVLRFEIGGAPGTPYVLFAGSAVPGCQPIAGIDGALALWAPILTVEIGTIAVPRARPPSFSSDRRLPCLLMTATAQTTLPTHLPPGMDIRFQALGMNSPRVGPLAFSRAVEVRCR